MTSTALAIAATPALAAPVTYNNDTLALTNDTNTTLTLTSGIIATLTTNGPETQGVYVTGSQPRGATWNFESTADLTVVAASTAAVTIDNTAGSAVMNFDNVDVIGNDAAGVYVDAFGFGSVRLNLNTGTVMRGGATGATAAGIYINRVGNNSGGSLRATIDSTSSVTNGGGAAAIDVVVAKSAATVLITNSGTVSGGAASGHGIYAHVNGIIDTLTNNSGGTITGGATGTSHGILIESNAIPIEYRGLNSLINDGTISGGTTAGDGVAVSSTGDVNSISNTGTITGGGGASNGISLAGTSLITTISNTGSGIIKGGTGSGGAGIKAGGTSTIGTITNSRFATIKGADTQGYGIHAAGGNITTVTNYGTIHGTGTTAQGIRVSSGSTITTINNGSSTLDLNTAKIAGGTTDDVNTGILIASGSTTINTISNYGTISSRLNADSAAGSGIHLSLGTLDTVENRGLIKGGTSTGSGISNNSITTITTINNYSTGTISGAKALDLVSGTADTTVNSAGTLSGTVNLASTFGTGSTLNIYGGTVTGNILGFDNTGNYGTVNFNLVGGTFGSGGVSGSGTFSTAGDIGQTGNRLLAVNVNSGTVTLNDDIYASTITIASGATMSLGSAPDINGNFVNNGTFNLGTQQVSITGNISGTGTITTTIQPGTGGTHGLIYSYGNADVSSMTIVPVYNPGDVVAGQTLTLIYDPGTLTFNSLGMQSLHGMTWRLVEAGDNGSDYQGLPYVTGSLLAISGAITDGVAASNAPSVNALSNYTGSNTDIDALQAGLTSTTDNNQAGAQTRPDASGGTVLATLNASEQAQDSITLHLNGSGVSSGDALRGAGAWAHGFGSTGGQGQISGVNGFEMESHGATFGADKKFADDAWRVGAAFTYADSNVDDTGVRTGSGQDIDSYIGNLYGRYTADKFYVDGIATAGLHSVDTRRRVNFVGNTLARGEFDSAQYGAKVEVGMPLSVKRFTVTPSLAFAHDTLQQDGYTETGAGGANLVVNDSSAHSLRSVIGVKAATSYSLDNGWRVRPALHVGYKHEFNDDLVPNQSVNFAGGGVAFTTPGLDLPQDSALFGAEAELASSSNFSLSARYDGEYRQGYMNHAAHLRGRYEF